MSASFDPNHVTKLQQLHSFVTGIWGKCKNLFATKTELQEAIESIPDPLPEATSADEGKVLTVDPNGDPEWSEPPNPQVQSNWSQTDSSAVDYIKNKPQNLVQDPSYVHTDNNYTSADKSKLDGIEAGAEKNVNADWNAANGDAEILNKPENLVQDPSYVHTDNNFTTTLKDKLDGIAAGAEANVQSNWNQTNTSADDYIKNKPTNLVQDASYVHTDNNFTTVEKNKLAGIEAGAEMNVNADWNAASGDAEILNKPENLVQDASYVHTDNNFTTALKDKLDGIAAGAEVNVQSDWDQTDSSSDDFIKNKPATKTLLVGTGVSIVETANDITISATGGEAQVQADWNETDTSDPSYIKNKPTIPVVPTTDQTYNASSSNPQSGTAVAEAIAGVNQVPTSTSADEGKVLKVNASGNSEWGAAPSSHVQANWDETDSSDPSYIQNKPTIPVVPTTDQAYDATSSNPQSGTAVAEAIADVNQVPASTSSDSGKVLTVNSNGTPEWQTGGGGGGDTVDQTYDPTSTNAQSGTAVAGALATVNQVPTSTSADEGKVLKVDANGDPEWATGGGGTQVQANWTQTDSSAVDYIKNKPSLATVATSGSYNDLSNKPAIPNKWSYTNVSVSRTGSGDSHRFVINNASPCLYVLSTYGQQTSTGYYTTRIRENANAMANDWDMWIPAANCTSFTVVIYNSSNSENNRYIFVTHGRNSASGAPDASNHTTIYNMAKGLSTASVTMKSYSNNVVLLEKRGNVIHMYC